MLELERAVMERNVGARASSNRAMCLCGVVDCGDLFQQCAGQLRGQIILSALPVITQHPKESRAGEIDILHAAGAQCTSARPGSRRLPAPNNMLACSSYPDVTLGGRLLQRGKLMEWKEAIPQQLL